MRQKDDRLLVALGPSSINSPTSALPYARRLRAIGDHFSPDLFIVSHVRLSPTSSAGTIPPNHRSWKGFIHDPDRSNTLNINQSLLIARQFFADTASSVEVSSATELLDPITPQYFDDLVSLGIVGWQNVSSPLYRELASGFSFPVGFEYSCDGPIEVAVDAIRDAAHKHEFLGATKQGLAGIVETKGNGDGFLIMEGKEGICGRNFDNRIAEVKRALTSSKLRPAVVVACSHGMFDFSPSLYEGKYHFVFGVVMATI